MVSAVTISFSQIYSEKTTPLVTLNLWRLLLPLIYLLPVDQTWSFNLFHEHKNVVKVYSYVYKCPACIYIVYVCVCVCPYVQCHDCVCVVHMCCSIMFVVYGGRGCTVCAPVQCTCECECGGKEVDGV